MARIDVKQVSVDLPIYGASDRSFKRSLIKVGSGGRVGIDDADGNIVVRAISDVSFNAQHGDRVALIGRNGAGKTTLLRVLAGILEPNAGLVSVDGEVASLFNVGGILDGQATGYENIKLAGRLLNLTSDEIDALVPDIEDFTELGPHLNLPVRTYSAGMTVRLAFGIATSTSPEILLLDEAIGAGDAHFLAKASKRAREFYGRSSIMVIASHDPNLLRQTCNKALWMEGGKVVVGGDICSVLDLYHETSVLEESAPRLENPPKVISGGSSGPDCAVEDVRLPDLKKFWVADRAPDSWIGLDHSRFLKRPVRASTIKIRGWSSLADPVLKELWVETSIDGFQNDIRSVAKIAPHEDLALHTHILNSQAKGLQWRIRPATSEARSGTWGLNYLELGFVEPEIICDIASNQNMLDYAASPSSNEAWMSSAESPFPWLGFFYGAGVQVAPRFLSLRQWESGEMQHSVAGVHLECSDDNFENDVEHIANIQMNVTPNQIHHYEIPNTKLRPAAYWRVSPAHRMTSGSWAISHLSLETDRCQSEFGQ